MHSADHATQLSKLLTCGHTDAEARSNLKQHQDSQWGTDILIHRWLSRSPSQAMHAHLRFVPSHAKCIDNAHIQSIRELNSTFESVLSALPSLRCDCKLALEGAAQCMCSIRYAQHVRSTVQAATSDCAVVQSMQSTVCRNTGGRQHLMVFPSGRGATLYLNWKARIADATFFVPESSFSDSQAALAPYSSSHRDIIIPGHMGAARLADLLQHNKPMHERTWLAAYKGSAQGKPWRVQVCAAHGFQQQSSHSSEPAERAHCTDGGQDLVNLLH